MTNNWKYSIVEAGVKLEPSQGNLDNEDKFVCNVICAKCSTCFQKDDPNSFTCCGLIKNDTEGCKYPFHVLNWIAVIAHFASFIAMAIIYGGVDQPFSIPYTETYIQWERLDASVQIEPPYDFGGTELLYVQNENDWNRCIENISKANCENIEYLQKLENDDYWVIQPSSAITTMPHGCLHTNFDSSGDREVQWNENPDSVKCDNLNSIPPGRRRLSHNRYVGEGNCLCTTSHIHGLDHFDKTQEGPTDPRITLEVCQSIPFMEDEHFGYEDESLLATLPNGCIYNNDEEEYYFNNNPDKTDCTPPTGPGGSDWHCVVWNPPTRDTTCEEQCPVLTEVKNGCPKDKGRINTTDPDEGDFCIGVTTDTITDSGVNLGILIIFFHVLSFLFQGIAGLSAFYPGGIYGFQYTTEIQAGRNLLRFVEYGFSASIMLIAIALLNGVTDVNLIACISVLTAATQLCGLVCEYLLALPIQDTQKKQNMFYVALVMHLSGWMQFLCAYGVIMHGFLRAATQDEDIRPPWFVYVIVWAIFAFYAVFGTVQVTEILCLKTSLCNWKAKQLRVESQGRINYQCKEMTYVILSLASKLTLGWLIFSNFIFRSN